MKTSGNITNIAKALLSVQNKFIVISKQSQGKNNQYASYDQLIREAKPILTAAGILLMQPVDHYEGEPAIKTILVHIESGEFIESTSIIKMMDITNKQGQSIINEAQQSGGGISYAKRYALAAILSWATGDYDYDQSTIDNIEDQKNSVIIGVESIMAVPDLTVYYQKNVTEKNNAELTKACASRKKVLILKAEDGNN